MDIMDYIRPELLILIPFLYGLGFLLKRHPKIENWIIPFVLYGVGVLFAPIYLIVVLDTGETLAQQIVVGIIQGVLIACATVGLYEGYKQIKNKGGDSDDSNKG